MNAKKLIIAFVAVSIAALIVSAFAVFTVARTYTRELISSTKAPDIPHPEPTSEPRDTGSLPTVNDAPLTECSQDTKEVSESAESTPEDETSASEPSGHILALSDGRLIISFGDEKVYERIIDVSDLQEKDRESLQKGIEFPDLESAMSAVYDIIS